MRHTVLALIVVLTFGCGSEAGDPPRGPAASPAPSEQTGPAGTSAVNTQNGLTVGAPCTAKDGYVPVYPECTSSSAGENPVNCAPNGSQAVTQVHQLPPGIGYCQTGPVFPHGYFTMNCAADSDCGAGNRCESDPVVLSHGVCRKACSSDTECTQPTSCLRQPNNPPPRFVRYCACLGCDRPQPF
jgi:hypothetical protein